jgi:lipoyl(octanoyl) transferase
MTLALRYVMSGAADGFKNMSVDEVLLGECRRGAIDGVLRVYEWTPPAVSLGHAQSVELIDTQRCRDLGVDLVRRVTGGGAVLHWEEVTYCLILKREIMPGLKWPKQFARLTGVALCRALESLGVGASLSQGGTHATFESLQSAAARHGTQSAATFHSSQSATAFHGMRSALCFESGTENEIIVEGRKLAGCAHKFTREAFFSHGSIMVGRTHLRIVELLRPEARIIGASTLGERSICLSDLLAVVPGLETVGQKLKKETEDSFGVSLAEARLSGCEEQLAGERAFVKRHDTGMAVGAVMHSRFS